MRVDQLIGTIRHRIDRFKKTQRLLAGIYDESHAFIGPKVVQIDIANSCRNTCLACWIRSPLLQGEISSDPIHSKQLPFDIVQKLIIDLADLGTQCIYLSGGGNVFTHPQVVDIIRLIKENNMFVVLHANFVDCGEEEAEDLVEIGIDDVTASVWAATPDTYVATHPDKTADDFERMTGVLKIISEIGHKGGIFRLYNVIMKQNYQEIEAMVDYAIDCNASSIHFAMVDILPGRTDSLLLTTDQINVLRESITSLDHRRPYLLREKNLEIRDFDIFQQRVFSDEADSGGYDRGQLDDAICYVGWMFLRVLGDGNVNSCLKSWRYQLGNVHTENIKDIWNSTMQQEFREKALRMDRNRNYFKLIGNNPDDEIGCYRSCDNMSNIMEIRGLLERMPGWRKKLATLMIPYYKKRSIM